MSVVDCTGREEPVEGYTYVDTYVAKIVALWSPEALEGICQYRLGKMAKAALMYTRHGGGDTLVLPGDIDSDVLTALRLNSRPASVHVELEADWYGDEVVERVLRPNSGFTRPARSKDCVLK